MKLLSSLKKLTIIVFLMTLGLLQTTHAATNQFSGDQKKQIQQIMREYLLDNPAILNEMVQKLQRGQYDKMMQSTLKAIPANAKQLFDDKTSPVEGNVKGKVTVVEFYDYQCGHCRNVAKTVDDIIKANKNLRVIFKAVSFFGERSSYAATVATAAEKQGKFYKFHMALLNSGKRLTKENVLKIAKSVGLNIEQLKKDMKQTAIADEVKDNTKLSMKLGIRGTPSFIITDADIPSSVKTQAKKQTLVIPGEVPEDQLQEAINKVRSGEANKS